MAASNSRPTADQVRSMIGYDPSSGVFTRTGSGRGIRKTGSVGTVKPDGRREISIFGSRHYAHRIAWIIMTGSWPENVIDHIDGDPSNNIWSNLRDVTVAENIQNQRRGQSKNRENPLIGAALIAAKNKWVAQITVGRKKTHIGYFDSEIEAHTAYVAVKRLIHKGNML